MGEAALDRVAVGYDNSEPAHDALALAKVLAPEADEFTLVQVVSRQALLHELAPAGVSALDDQRRFRHERQLQQTAEAAGARARTVVADSAVRGLEHAARETPAELIVLGSSHRGRIGQILAGGVALRLLNGAPCAVALAPAGYTKEPSRLAAVGVGFEGGAEAGAALALAARVAVAHAARLELIGVAGHGYDDARLDLTPGLGHRSLSHEQLEPLVQAAAAALPQSLERTLAIERGEPVAVLDQRSAELDLLVLGSRRHGPVGGVLLGSVASELVLSARCPLLVVPPS